MSSRALLHMWSFKIFLETIVDSQEVEMVIEDHPLENQKQNEQAIVRQLSDQVRLRIKVKKEHG